MTQPTSNREKTERIVLPTIAFCIGLAVWVVLTHLKKADGQPLYNDYCLPHPNAVVTSLVEEFRSGRLVKDIISSLFCVSASFLISVLTGVPIGIALGRHHKLRLTFLPMVNFFRCLSPLAWIPFAIFWFGTGATGEMFLIFMSTFFPIVLATLAAVSTIPAVRFQVAKDYGLEGFQLLTNVTLPAILPQVITALRVTAGVAWVVVVAAEMAGVQNGLGFGIADARDGLRMDIVVCYMIIIGIIGVMLDRLLSQLTHLPNVRWGYEH
jgi:NitT/TauT family transport system permease protein